MSAVKLAIMLVAVSLIMLSNPSSASLLIQDANFTPINSTTTPALLPGNITTKLIKLCAQDENLSSVGFFGNSNQFTISFSASPPITNILNGTCSDLNITLAAPTSINEGDYATQIFFLTLSEMKTLTLNTHVNAIINWSISGIASFTERIVSNPPDAFLLTEADIQNLGNTPITITTSLIGSGNDYFVMDFGNINIQPSGISKVPIFMLVPATINVGNYNTKLTWAIQNFNSTKTYEVNLTIPDVTPPNLTVSANRPSIQWGESQSITATVTDNVNVTEVYLFWNNTRQNFTSVGSNQWTYRIENIKQEGTATINVSAKDSRNNSVSKTISWNMTLFPYVKTVQPLKMGKYKVGTEGSRTFLTSEAQTNVSLTITNFQFTPLDPNETAEGKVTFAIAWNDPFGTRTTPIALGTTIGFSPLIGDTKLKVHSTVMGAFVGEIAIILPDGYENKQRTISFDGEFGNYTVPPSQTFKLPGAISDMKCEIVEGIGYADSKQICNVDFPIDTTSDQLNIIISKTSLDTERENFRNQITVLTTDNVDLKFRQNIIVFGSLFALIIIAGLIWYREQLATRILLKNK